MTMVDPNNRTPIVAGRAVTRQIRRTPAPPMAFDGRVAPAVEDAMSTTPRLSIGLPVYNGGRYLAKALDSLLGQSYEDFEIVIADNASTDDTAELCRDYERRDQRIRYFRQPRNIGFRQTTTLSSKLPEAVSSSGRPTTTCTVGSFSGVALRRSTSTPRSCWPTPGRPTSTNQTPSSPLPCTRSQRMEQRLLNAFGASSSGLEATTFMLSCARTPSDGFPTGQLPPC